MGAKADEEQTKKPVGGGLVAGGQAGTQQGGPGGSAAVEPQQPEPGTSQPGTGSVAKEPLQPGAQESQAKDTGLPEGATLESLVAEVERQIRAEYEGPDGHLSKLRSSLERQIAEMRRGKALETRRAVDAAMQMAEKNPGQALQILAGELQSYQERDMQALQEAETYHWLEGVVQELDLNMEDDDVKKVVHQAGPLGPEKAKFALLGELTKLSNTRVREEAKGVEARLKKMESGLADMVRQQVATLITGSGVRQVDPAEPTTTAMREENPIANINNPTRLLTMGYEAAKKKGGG